MCKALWRNFGKVINVSVYAPKPSALPGELHLEMHVCVLKNRCVSSLRVPQMYAQRLIGRVHNFSFLALPFRLCCRLSENSFIQTRTAAAQKAIHEPKNADGRSKNGVCYYIIKSTACQGCEKREAATVHGTIEEFRQRKDKARAKHGRTRGKMPCSIRKNHAVK